MNINELTSEPIHSLPQWIVAQLTKDTAFPFLVVARDHGM